MKSELMKEAYVVGVTHGSLTEAVVIALIEIREALEENTAVQRQLLATGDAAAKGVVDLIEDLGAMRDGIDGMRQTVEAQRDLTGGIVKTLGEHADLLVQLAEGKQDKGTGVETRAFLPDAG